MRPYWLNFHITSFSANAWPSIFLNNNLLIYITFLGSLLLFLMQHKIFFWARKTVRMAASCASSSLDLHPVHRLKKKLEQWIVAPTKEPFLFQSC